MKIYNTKIQADYDALMIELEEKGYKWLSGHKPTSKDYWNEENSCIKISGKNITFGSIEQHKKDYPDIPIIEYKAKGDKQMLTTECKQCHKKWHHDNAKYCTMCGKKLVDEPEFKVGDIVSSEIFIDGSGIIRLEEDLINDFSRIKGLWYIKKDCEIKDTSFGVINKKTRHATPEEIAEYEAALTFHENGREPFEVKKGDILKDDEGISFFVDFPSNLKRESFTSGRYTFLKTAEEFNEWLGVSDE